LDPRQGSIEIHQQCAPVVFAQAPRSVFSEAKFASQQNQQSANLLAFQSHFHPFPKQDPGPSAFSVQAGSCHCKILAPNFT
jgi:hypothetical protein